MAMRTVLGRYLARELYVASSRYLSGNGNWAGFSKALCTKPAGGDVIGTERFVVPIMKGKHPRVNENLKVVGEIPSVRTKAPQTEDADTVELFEKWMKACHRVYKDEAEKARRFEIFKGRVKLMKSNPYEVDLDLYSDMTKEKEEYYSAGRRLYSRSRPPRRLYRGKSRQLCTKQVGDPSETSKDEEAKVALNKKGKRKRKRKMKALQVEDADAIQMFEKWIKKFRPYYKDEAEKARDFQHFKRVNPTNASPDSIWPPVGLHTDMSPMEIARRSHWSLSTGRCL